MTKSYYIFSLISYLLLSFSGCNSTNQRGSNTFKDSLGLQAIKKLTIPIDESTDLRTYNVYYYNELENDLELLCYENKGTNSIQFYNLATRKLYHNLKLKKEGQNGVGNIAGFLIKNMDSIFVADGTRRYLSLVNKEGKVLKKYKFTGPEDKSVSVFLTYTYRPMLFDKEMENIHMICGPDNYDFSHPKFWDGYIAGSLNITSGVVDYLMKAPEEYIGSIYGAFFSHHSVTKNTEDQFIYSFPMDDEIIVTNFTSPYKKYYAGSKYFNHIPPMDKPDIPRELNFYIESNSFREIAYDKWRRVYYRFAYKGVDSHTPDGQQKTWNDKEPSIIILDAQFQKVGETKLPTGVYHTRDYFVSKEGLHISNNHLKNSELNEDELSFTLFELYEKDI